MIDEALLEAAAVVLDNRAAALRQMSALPRAELVVTFEQIRAGITADDLNELLRLAGAVEMREPSVYRMAVGTDDDAAAIRIAFAACRPPQGTNLTRNNYVADSRCVYVGSSLTPRRSRRSEGDKVFTSPLLIDGLRVWHPTPRG